MVGCAAGDMEKAIYTSPRVILRVSDFGRPRVSLGAKGDGDGLVMKCATLKKCVCECGVLVGASSAFMRVRGVNTPPFAPEWEIGQANVYITWSGSHDLGHVEMSGRRCELEYMPNYAEFCLSYIDTCLLWSACK